MSQNTRPLISVLIPVYNDEDTIAATLESCINQTFQNFEIVVVNDASTDNTLGVINKYAKSDSRIKVFSNKENLKTYHTIEVALMNAVGDYTMVISGDDTYDLHALETVANVINANKDVDIIQFRRRHINSDGKITSITGPEDVRLEGDEILKYMFNRTRGSRVNHKVIRRSWQKKIRKQIKIDKKLVLGEDQVLAFILCLKAKVYIGISDVLYNYSYGAGNDGKKDIDLDHFVNYRMNIIDSMDELKRLLKSMNVELWVWDYYEALRREHYAWSVSVTDKMTSKIRNEALSIWTSRVGIVDTLVGVNLFTPAFTEKYLKFLLHHSKNNISTEVFNEYVKLINSEYGLRIADNTKAVDLLLKDNNKLKHELRSHMSVGRSIKLTAGNIKRRIVYGKKK